MQYLVSTLYQFADVGRNNHFIAYSVEQMSLGTSNINWRGRSSVAKLNNCLARMSSWSEVVSGSTGISFG